MREIIQNTPQNQERGQKTVCFVKKKEQNRWKEQGVHTDKGYRKQLRCRRQDRYRAWQQDTSLAFRYALLVFSIEYEEGTVPFVYSAHRHRSFIFIMIYYHRRIADS